METPRRLIFYYVHLRVESHLLINNDKNNNFEVKNLSFKTKSDVDEDLKHIPRGLKGSTQNFLRLYYSDMRKHDIAKSPKTKEETLKNAIAELRKKEPNFAPQYDKDYFKNL